MTEANKVASVSCDAGDAEACSLLGMSLYLAAVADRVSPEPALRPFLTACDRGEWHGCGMAAAVKSALKQDPRPTAARAFPMAMSACREGKGAACVYVGDWAARAGDTITATVHYRTACEMNLEATGAAAIDEYACRKAIELGSSRRELAAGVKPGDPHPEFRRVSGEKQILPTRGEQGGMCKLGLAQVTARLVLCLADSGAPTKIAFVEFSGARDWNRKLFEAIRAWRYTPFVGESGGPEPICTGLTFHFKPNC